MVTTQWHPTLSAQRQSLVDPSAQRWLSVHLPTQKQWLVHLTAQRQLSGYSLDLFFTSLLQLLYSGTFITDCPCWCWENSCNLWVMEGISSTWGSRGPFKTIASRFQTKLPYRNGNNQHIPVLSLHSNWWGGMPTWFSISCSQGASIGFTGFIAQWWHYSTRQAGLGPLVHSPWVNPPQIPEKVPVGEHNVFFYPLLLTLWHFPPRGRSQSHLA